MTSEAPERKPMQTYAVLVLLAVVLLVGLYDLAAVLSAGRLATISQVIQGWADAYPFLSMLAALLFAHLFGRRPPTQ